MNNKNNKPRKRNKQMVKLLQEAVLELKPLPKGFIYLFVFIDGDPDHLKPYCLN